ncbi:MAG: DegV family protein [Anaerolineales bacterium]|nr:DegV family protein [Anaerolineales bacterium]MCB9434966.1 DegV family protein [Ardenticatenaceae bacterium]
MTIRIVTDSACDVPQHLAEAYGITVVPVYVNIGQESYLDGVDISRHDFYKNLYSYPTPPTTAAPASGAFTEAYETLAAAGASEILSLHIASSLSNTFNAARLGAEAAEGVAVTLFDTQQVSMGGGLLVLLAAEAAAAGSSMAQIVAMLEKRVSRTRVIGMLDTLESLRYSGRVSWATFGFGTLLQIKPIMVVANGVVDVAARVRTRKRAVAHLLEMVADGAPFERLAIIHVAAMEAAAELQQQVAHLFPAGIEPIIMELTPAIGAHFGLGAVGFAYVTINGG